jgi:uncharacterized repeat protein (TIGR01451 family)
MKARTLLTGLLAGLFISTGALAAAVGSIELQTVAQQMKTTVAADGTKHTDVVPAGRVLPGTEVIYTIRYRNVGKKAAENVVVSDPVPRHMNYVAGTASGKNTAISFSVDGGKHWASSPDELEIDNGNGTTRTATAKDVTNIRWVVKGKLAAGASGFVSFHALLQ